MIISTIINNLIRLAMAGNAGGEEEVGTCDSNKSIGMPKKVRVENAAVICIDNIILDILRVHNATL